MISLQTNHFLTKRKITRW